MMRRATLFPAKTWSRHFATAAAEARPNSSLLGKISIGSLSTRKVRVAGTEVILYLVKFRKLAVAIGGDVNPRFAAREGSSGPRRGQASGPRGGRDRAA